VKIFLPARQTGESVELLSHPNLSSPRADRASPLVLIFMRNLIASALPPRQRLPCYPLSIPARAQCNCPFPRTPRLVLDRPDDPGAYPAALKFHWNIDVDKLKVLPSFLYYDATYKPAVHFSNQYVASSDYVGGPPRGRQSFRLLKWRAQASAEPYVFAKAKR